VCFGGLN